MRKRYLLGVIFIIFAIGIFWYGFSEATVTSPQLISISAPSSVVQGGSFNIAFNGASNHTRLEVSYVGPESFPWTSVGTNNPYTLTLSPSAPAGDYTLYARACNELGCSGVVYTNITVGSSARASIGNFSFTYGGLTRNYTDYASSNPSPPPVVQIPSGAQVSFNGSWNLIGSGSSDYMDLGCQSENIISVAIGGTTYCQQGSNGPYRDPALTNPFTAVLTTPSTSLTKRVILVLRVFDSRGLAQEASLPLDVLPASAAGGSGVGPQLSAITLNPDTINQGVTSVQIIFNGAFNHNRFEIMGPGAIDWTPVGSAGAYNLALSPALAQGAYNIRARACDNSGSCSQIRGARLTVNPAGTAEVTPSRAAISSFTISGATLINNIPTLNINSGSTATVSGYLTGPSRLATIGCTANTGDNVTVYNLNDSGTYCGTSGNGPWLNPRTNSYTLRFTNSSTEARQISMVLKVYDAVSGTNIETSTPADTKTINITVGAGTGAGGAAGGGGTAESNRAAISSFTISGSTLVSGIPTLTIDSASAATISGSISGPVRLATLGCTVNDNNDVSVYNLGDGGTYCGTSGNGPWLNPSATSYQLRFTNRSSQSKTITLALKVYDATSGINVATNQPADTKTINVTVGPRAGAGESTPPAGGGAAGSGRAAISSFTISGSSLVSGTPTLTIDSASAATVSSSISGPVRLATLGCTVNPNNDVSVYNFSDGGTYCGTSGNGPWLNPSATSYRLKFTNHTNQPKTIVLALKVYDETSGTNIETSTPADTKLINVTVNAGGVTSMVTPGTQRDLFPERSREMQFGQRGEDITKLQICLNSISGILSSPITRFGYFGTKTRGGVIAVHQRFPNEICTTGGRECRVDGGVVNSTGIVGFNTKIKLNSLCAEQSGFEED